MDKQFLAENTKTVDLSRKLKKRLYREFQAIHKNRQPGTNDITDQILTIADKYGISPDTSAICFQAFCIATESNLTFIKPAQ